MKEQATAPRQSR